MGLIKTDEFYELEESLVAAGLFAPRYGSYALHTAAIGALCVMSAFVLVSGAGFWAQMANAVLLAFAFGQGGLLMHAVAHGQTALRPRCQQMLHYAIDLLLCWSTGWWRYKHELHHQAPNHPGSDPDVRIAFLAFTPKQAKEKRGLYRFTARYQHCLFPLLLFFEIWHLRCAGMRFLLAQRTRTAWCNLLLMTAHATVYLGVLFSLLPFWSALVFVATHNGVLGFYLGMVFAPNHIGMPVGEAPSGDYLAAQVTTARNIRGEWWTTALFGGLNFQIEHHLFSGMPHYNLRKAARIVEPFCKARGIPYHSVGIGTAYREVYMHLREMAQHAR